MASLLADELRKAEDKPWEVLNAATNSWGPRNELAYLQQYGLFDTDTLVLVINTDDLYATKPISLVVGRSYSYPDKPPGLALIELYQLYLAPPRQIPELEELRNQRKQNLIDNLAAIREIKAIAAKSNIQFILALTPLLSELQTGSTPEETEARNKLQQLVAAEEIEYQDFLQIWSDFPQPESLYRDRIHPSPQGNTKIIDRLASIIVGQK
ncbi:MAG: hypothetical protein AAGE96_21570 [Cyanobacteria bacterium P01_G01_bin.19]